MMSSLFSLVRKRVLRCMFLRRSMSKAFATLRMTQARFSDVFGFSLDAIKHWEGGRRTPEAPARTLLTVIDKNPAAVLTALQSAASAVAARSSKVRTVRYKSIKKIRRSSHYVARASQPEDRSHR